MDKINIVNTFTNYVDQLRNTECSQKEKISCFQHIAECILSPAMVSNINYATHCSTATNVLLMFCEDLDSTVRMSAEENLNRIFRALERTRVSRILMDLYGEIKRNGNQRSLRICLNLFAYYAPQVKEKHVKWYALRLSQCLQTIALRKETLLCESLCEFVRSFGKYLQIGLTDSETCKLFEVFIANIGSDCAVKRRCSSQNCISLIENSHNKSLMASHGLNKVIEMLLKDQQTHTILGALGFLRILLPLIIRGFDNDCNDESDNTTHGSTKKTFNRSASVNSTCTNSMTAVMMTMMTNESKQIIEIFDYCLHLLSISHTSNHSIINASLEVINAILQAIDGSSSSIGDSSTSITATTAQCLQQLLRNQQLQHNEYLRRRKSLKNQIFQLKNYEMTSAVASAAAVGKETEELAAATNPFRLVSTPTATPTRKQQRYPTTQDGGGDGENVDDNYELNKHKTASAMTANSGVVVHESLLLADTEKHQQQQHRTAFKLGMQKIANAQEDGGCLLTATKTTTTSPATSSILGIHAQDDKSNKNKKNIIADDVDEANADVDDNDDEANKNSLAYLAYVNNQQIKNHQDISSQIKIQKNDVDDTDDDDDDFTTLSEINEPQKAFALTTAAANAYAISSEPSLTTTIDVDNLIDAIDATAKTTAMTAPVKHQPQMKEQRQQLQLLNVDAIAPTTSNPSSPGDDKSQHLSDIDNESFNSIDFEAEITIGGFAATTEATNTATTSATTIVGEVSAATAKSSNNNTKGNTSENTTIGSFFNNLLTHPSTESMTKLFRPSTLTGNKSTPTKVSSIKSSITDATTTTSVSPTTATTMSSDKSEQDGISINSAAAVSTSAADTLSLESITSSSQRHDTEELPLSPTRKHSYSSNSCGLNDETLSTTASVTASTAILMDSNTRISSDDDDEQEAVVLRKHSPVRRTPNVNPFLKDSPLKQTLVGLPQLNVSIGSIFEQSIIFYTARLTAALFLLTGQPHQLQTDQMTRVSIKNLSICVVAQCVRLSPKILTLTLEISPKELQNLQHTMKLAEKVTAEKHDAGTLPFSLSQSSSSSGSPTQQHSDSSSNLGKDYELLNAGGDVVDYVCGGKKLPQTPRKTFDFASVEDGDGAALLLEIKDDHFGVSTTDYFLNQPLSRSVDPVLLTPQVSPPPLLPKSTPQRALSKSEIIESTRKKIYHYKEDAVPSSPPPRPPKRIKSLRKKMEKVKVCKDVADAMLPLLTMRNIKAATVTTNTNPRQQIADVLLFFTHVDPILRGGVQQIIGNYIQASNAGLCMRNGLRLNYLLAILIKGLQDEIHTVVIHALNAFDKAFPLVLAKYLTGTRRNCCCCCHYQQQQQQPKEHHEKRKQTATRAFEDNSSNINNTTSSNIRIQKSPNDATATRKHCCRTCTVVDPCNASFSTLSSSSCVKKMQQQQLDNDELIATLLKSFQLKSKNILIDDNEVMVEEENNKKLDNDNEGNLVDDYDDNNDPLVDDGLHNKLHHIDNAIAKKIVAAEDAEQSSLKGQQQHRLLFISPKLLLNKLRLCYHNKYWLVQSKYAEVVSNLNYAALQAYYLDNNNDGDSTDVVLTYEQIFLDEILQLIADDDVRVREHAAECLCHFIIQNAKYRHQRQQQQNVTVDLNATSKISSASSSLSTSPSCSMETFATNFNLLWDFFDYRIFSGMSPALRNLFTVHSSIAPPLTATKNYPNIDCNNFVAFSIQRQTVLEEKLLAKVLYRLTNKLMELNDKNTQFGIIYALKLLLKHFNFVDYQRAWTEFNLMEICMKLSYYNYATAVDLNCQNDLIDVTGKLMAGTIIGSNVQQQQFLDNLLTHILKIINIYYHVFSNQKPLAFTKVQKSDLFTNAKELAIMQCWGYFGSDYVYIKLYNILKSANDSYKITINQTSGGILMSLLKTCINTLSLCIEMRSYTSNATTADAVTTNTTNFTQQDTGMSSYPPATVLKLIEEILQYLTKIINYAPVECIGCLRQLLKYLFARNYGNRQKEWYVKFVQPYFRARVQTQQRQKPTTAIVAEQSNSTNAISFVENSRPAAMAATASTANSEYNLIAAATNSAEHWIIFGKLITQGLNYHTNKSENENDCAKHIKLFEPLVIYCLTLFMKSNAIVQKPIVELLSQLLDVDVTYSILDSKNVIFDQIRNNLDLIEGGIARSGHIIPPTIKFLFQLTNKSDRKLITIPKIISITNNLLANNAIHGCAVLALKTLAYEIFFMSANNITANTTTTSIVQPDSYAEQRAAFLSPISRSPLMAGRRAFQSPIMRSPLATPPLAEKQQHQQQLLPEDDAAAAAEALLVTTRELDTQKEVVLGMLDKFIDAKECQHVLGLLLLLERSMQQQQQQEEEQQQQLATAATTSGQRQQQQIQRKLSLQQESDFTNEMLLPLLQLQDPGAVYAIICHALGEGRIRVVEWRGFFVLDALFKNCGKLVLADSKEFLSLLQLFITKNVENFSDLSQATIILENVILKTEEIYLVNHIKLYLKNHHQHQQQHSHHNQPHSTYLLARLPDGPSTSTAAAAALTSGSNTSTTTNANRNNLTTNPINEIQYFAQVLCEKLDECIGKLTGHLDLSNSSTTSNNNYNKFYYDRKYCSLVVRFIRALRNICCCSRLQDALQSVFRLALNESNFLLKYNNLLTLGIGTGPAPICVVGQSDVLLQVDGQLLDVELQLQRAVLELLVALRLLDICVILQQLQADNQDIKPNVRRILLREICELNPNAMNWNLQQVQQLFHPTFLNILIAENFAFVCSLCEVDEEFCSLWLYALIDNCQVLQNHSIRVLTRYALRFCSRSCSISCIAKFLHLLAKLHHYAVESNKSALEQLIERTAHCLISTAPHHDKNAIYDSFIRMDESSIGRLQYILLNDLENLNTKGNSLEFEHKIIDEKWLFNQLIKFSAQTDYDAHKLVRILLDIQSEHKLHKIFTTAEFNLGRTLQPAITCALQSMLATFRNNCMQHNPHINYMQPNPLARVASAVLMSRIGVLTEEAATVGQQQHQHELLQLAIAVTSLMEHIKRIEETALIYIEAKFVEKFVREQLLRYESIRTLVHFLQFCCEQTKQLLLLLVGCEGGSGGVLSASDQQTMFTYLRCIDALLKQRFIWRQLNQMEKVTGSTTTYNIGGGGGTQEETDTATTAILSQKQRNKLLCNLLDMLLLLATKSIQNTIFYKRYKLHDASVCIGGSDTNSTVGAAVFSDNCDNDDDDGDGEGFALLQAFVPKAIFIAKLIETKIDIDGASGMLSTSYISGRGGDGDVAAAAAGFCAVGGGGGGVGVAGGVSSSSSGGGAGGVVVAGGAAVHFDDNFAGIEIEGAQVLLNILKSIGISIFRTNQFYAYAVTPFEIIQQQQQQQQHQAQEQQQAFGNSCGGGSNNTTPTKRAAAMTSTTTIGKLPTLPVESLSDVDVLRKFVKRLSIFGFTTRQQFEEYFMTFLLLINKVYDENMVDQQEQFQIKSTCLEAILELLITYKTFPIVGNKLSHFHHTTRWSRINCDSISLKKLHKVQLLVSEANVFYQPNLERHLAAIVTDINDDIQDTVIGTKYFLINQMDLNFVWQQMEAHSQPTSPNDGRTDANDASTTTTTTSSTTNLSRNSQTINAEDVATKNYRYFTTNSDIDFKSSSQLIFDVMMQIIEHNHILVLPNLVKFCEICESRDQIKWIKDKALKMQESIPMDDTISHQHIIYLLCKTQAMLIPTLGELQQLCYLIGNYLKSSHVFIRNATLAGVLCLLECCTKTNTTIGKLSEELALLRDLIVGYINRHGLIDQSSIQCSDMHAKLVWTLNFSLIAWTSKFVPQCHLLSNTIIAAANFLQKTKNEGLYLTVLHGLERMVVISTINGNSNIVTPVLHQKIEKLALELVKLENEKFSIPALKLLLSCMYVGSAKQLENTELSNGIVQDDPEIIAQQADKVDIILHCIKSSTRNAAWIYGQVLCQIIRDLVPPNEILTKVIKEFLAINQPHCDVIAMIVYQVFRSAIDSSFQQMLQDWLICSLPTFLALPEQKGVWCLSVIFLSASINLHLIKLFPVVLSAREFRKLGQHEIALFVTAAQDFHAKLSVEQKMRFRDAFKKFQQNQIYAKMLQSL